MARNSALITGASAGIGAIYADRLARRGYDLVLVARNGDRLEAIAERLRAETGRSIETVTADLGHQDDLARIERLLGERLDITMLVNNAGVGAVTPLLNSDVQAMAAIIDLNVLALTRLTYAAATAFVAHGGGTIINIASVVAISPETLNGVYGASKAFVLALTQSMHHELSDKGIRVQAVLPGATATEFWSHAGLPHQNLPKEIVMEAGEMVDAALTGLDLGEVVTLPALQNADDWERYEGLRRELSTRISLASAAPRYSSQIRSPQG
ncbi:AraC family transcriptional regulator (plasmid) [Sphingomonas panacis]|uniref:NADP-dependent 3-hydroxy acid dehydrogenase YdfG n=1 Tax=Sphingomonas panacis TaxID=1560345 RepID=A0A1B3ZIH4_9SPHN|nr:SDR family oxidoreductase [Sphingomonas panacis]AOH87233.1 AraC family transcriptional regulator [Sphingomonas panacis]